MRFDIITCGSATVDAFAHTDSEEIKIKTRLGSQTLLAYPSGGKLLIEKLQIEVGGGGTNTAVGFARQGFKTGYIGCIGSDENARQIESVLQKEKVAFLGQKRNGLSGYSIILDSLGHDRTILAFKGTNDLLDYKKMSISSAPWYYFSSMLGKSFDAQLKIAQFAKKIGSKIVFNPSSYQCKLGLKKLMPMLKQTDILIFNYEEAQILTGLSTQNRNTLHQFIFENLQIPIAIITDGPNMLTCFDGEKIYTLKPQTVRVVEATGAGDAFACGFLGNYMRTKDIRQALKSGLANSQSVLKFVGAKKGLLSKPLRK